MGFVLLWIESFAAVLLLTAAGVSFFVRWRWRWLALLAILPAFAVATITLIPMCTARVGVDYNAGSTAGRFINGAIAWALAIAVMSVVIAVVAMRKVGEPRQPRGRGWSAIRLALGGVAAIVLAIATVWAMNTALMSRVAALRAEAGALALAAAPARMPDHENAAPLYVAAAESFRNSQDDWTKIDRWRNSDQLDPNDPDLNAFLSRWTEGLDLVRRAAALPGCQFEFSLYQPMGAMDQLNRIREAMIIVSLQARFVAAKSGPQNAIPYINQLMRMSHHAAGVPDSNAMLVAVAIESVTFQTLDRILSQGAPPAKAPAPGFRVDDDGGRVKFEFLDRPVLFRYYLQRTLQSEEARLYGWLAGLSEHATGFGLLLLDDDLAVYQWLFPQMNQALAKPYPECLREWDGIEARLKKTHRLASPIWIRLLPAIARADASRRVSQLAVAVAAYRAAEGKLPAKAEDVVPKYLSQVPIDPFNGEPLKLKPTPEGVVVYSVGPDGVDDGGRPLDNDKEMKGDIRVRIGEKK